MPLPRRVRSDGEAVHVAGQGSCGAGVVTAVSRSWWRVVGAAEVDVR